MNDLTFALLAALVCLALGAVTGMIVDSAGWLLAEIWGLM